MTNKVNSYTNNGSDSVEKGLILCGKTLATVGLVAAVASSIFLIIAASVNPMEVSGYLGHVAMVIAKAKPLLGISCKTCVYVGSSIALAASAIIAALVLKEIFPKKPENINQHVQEDEVEEGEARNKSLVQLFSKARVAIEIDKGRPWDEIQREFEKFLDGVNENALPLTVVFTDAYLHLRFGGPDRLIARDFLRVMMRIREPSNTRTQVEYDKLINHWREISGEDQLEWGDEYD